MPITYSGTIDPDTNDEQYISYGQKYKYIGKISGSYADGTHYEASAVAIDDNHLLTAAHVIENAKSIIFILDDKQFDIKHIIVPTEFKSEKFNIADIALGYSEKSFKLAEYPELYDETNEVGQICSISGYGFSGTFISGGTVCDNKKRAGNNYIEAIEMDILVCDVSHKNDKNYVDMEFLIANGDSGGGLFIANKLAGINSCIFGTTKTLHSKYGENSGHTRISKYRDWIIRNKHKNDLTSKNPAIQ